MHCLYILLLKDKRIYTGTTANLTKRLSEHQKGKVSSTKNKKPLKLIHYESYLMKSDALRREKFSRPKSRRGIQLTVPLKKLAGILKVLLIE